MIAFYKLSSLKNSVRLIRFRSSSISAVGYMGFVRFISMDIEKLAGMVYTIDESGLPYVRFPVTWVKTTYHKKKRFFSFVTLSLSTDHSDNTDNQH